MLDSDSTYPTVLDTCNPSYKFWQAYKKHRKTDTVIRSGFGLCGCYPYAPDKPKTEARDEAVSQHILGTMHMMYLLSIFFPYLFTVNHEDPESFSEREKVELRVHRMMVLLMYHDIGETDSKLGDRPDDGSQNRAEKDRLEMECIRDFTRGYPFTARSDIRRDFTQFQDPKNPDATDTHSEFYGEMIQLARLCDKIDAVLNAICYEASGHGGHLEYKREHFGSITDQDQKFINVAEGDDSVSAVWSVHITTDYNDYFGFKELMSVVRAAIREVRGTWFTWWTPYCEKLNIPDYDWNS